MWIAGVWVPKSTVIQLSPAVINMHPSIWGADAAEFKPDRWTQTGPFPRIPGFAFETFHNGPRKCIGMNLSLVEMKVFIAQIVSRFQVDPIDDGPIEVASPAFTLRPKDKLRVRLQEL